MTHHAKATGSSRPARLGISAAFALILLAFAGIAAPSALAATPPTATANPAEFIGVTTATLTGTVNPHGEAGSAPTSWRFEFTPAEDNTWSQINSGTIEGAAAEAEEPIAVESPFGYFGESAPGSEYEFRIVAERGAETGEATSPAFETKPLTAPVLKANPATEIHFDRAHLSGSINPEGGNVNHYGPNSSPEAFSIYWQIQYRIEGSAEEWITAPGAEGNLEGLQASATNPIKEAIDLPPATLQPGHNYEVRLHAFYFNGSQAAESSPQTFTTTSVNPPTVATALQVTGVSAEAAHFAGEAGSGGTGEGEAQGTFQFACNPGCPGLEARQFGAEGIADGSNHPVEAEPTALQPNTAYEVTLTAQNASGVASSETAHFTTQGLAPDVTTDPAQDISTDHATFTGRINPHNGDPTHYWFEYGTTESYGSYAILLPPEPAFNPVEETEAQFKARHEAWQAEVAELKAHAATEHGISMQAFEVNTSGPNSIHAAIIRVQGFSPATTYHFRLAAENGTGPVVHGADRTFNTTTPPSESGCENEARRTEQHAAYLPDCRAYEQVSPPQKNGIDLIGDSSRTRAAADGSAATFSTLGALPGTQGGTISFDYIATRGPSGWATHPITPPQEPGTFNAALNGFSDALYPELSPDLDRGVFRAYSPVPGAAANQPSVERVVNLYLASGLRSPAASFALLTPCPLCEAAQPPAVLPAISSAAQRPSFAAASADISKVLFESRLQLLPGLTAGVHLYESAAGRLLTVNQVPPPGQSFCGASASACVSTPSTQAGQGASNTRYTFHTISTDGRRVFFTVPSSGTEGALYLRDDHGTESTADDTTTRLNAVEPGNGEAIPSAAPATFWDASADGSRAFFTTKAQLLPEDTNGSEDLYMYDTGAPAGHHLTLLSSSENPEEASFVNGVIGASADGRYVYFIANGQLVAGQPPVQNGIYEWHDGALSFVGQLRSQDDIGNDVPGRWDLSVPQSSRVAPDGRHLLFASTSGVGLTGYDQNFNKEFYLYDAATGRLSCASCNPDGSPAGAGAFNRTRANSGGSITTPYRNHPLAADGRYVFFSTAESLLPRDTNGVSDAYSYDTQTGTVHLLSSGTDPEPSWFMDASADGRDAFILTRQQLTGSDTDNLYDLYDARAGGGFPEPSPPSAPCNGALTCHGSPPSPPTAQTPSSATTVAPGNPEPTRPCPKGKVKKHGKCVKKHTKGQKHKKQSKKHAKRSQSRTAGHSSGGAQ